MSLVHKSIVRMNDEFLCATCGRSWDINDDEPPECDAKPRTPQPRPVTRNPHWGREEMAEIKRIEEEIIITPKCPAYLVSTNGVHGVMLYAPDAASAIDFMTRITMRPMIGAKAYHIAFMDEYSTGRWPRVEVNPVVIGAARSRAAVPGIPVIPITIIQYLSSPEYQ